MYGAIRLLIVHTSPYIRPLLRELLSRDPRLQVAGVAGDPDGAEFMAHSVRPAVIIWGLLLGSAENDPILGRLLALPKTHVFLMPGSDADQVSLAEVWLKRGACGTLECPPLSLTALPDAVGAGLHSRIHAAMGLKSVPPG